MNLRTVPVSRCLDKKLKIFGLEVVDLFLILMTLSVLNLVFGQSGMSLLLVWSPSTLLALTLYFGKRGKPENYLIHWLRFQTSPGTYSAFPGPTGWVSPPRIKRTVVSQEVSDV